MYILGAEVPMRAERQINHSPTRPSCFITSNEPMNAIRHTVLPAYHLFTQIIYSPSCLSMAFSSTMLHTRLIFPCPNS